MACKVSKSHLVLGLTLVLCLGIGLFLLPIVLDGLTAAPDTAMGGQEERADRISAAATEDGVGEEPAGTRVREDRPAAPLSRGTYTARVPPGTYRVSFRLHTEEVLGMRGRR